MASYITLPDGTRCYSGPDCRQHGGAIALLDKPVVTQVSDAESFEAALMERRDAPKDVLAKGGKLRELAPGESRTYADVVQSGDRGSRVVTSVDLSTPPGHFVASVRMLGITTEYLIDGTEGDKKAKIVGRIELVKDRGRIYRGDGLKGGEYLGHLGAGSNKTFDDAFLDITEKPAPAPVAPASTPGVFGLPPGTFPTFSPYDINNYTSSVGIALREVSTNSEFKKAIKQVRSEPLNVVRVVRARFTGKHGFFAGDKPVVSGPKDGTPLVIDMGRSYTSLEVASGNVVINAEGVYGGGVTVKQGAAVTIITPPGKFTIDVEDGAAVTVYPRAGARGGVWSNGGANVVIDDTYEHTIENRVRSGR